MKPSAHSIGVAALLVASGAATWLGSPERELSMHAIFEIWADVLRDTDSLGLQLTRARPGEEMELGKTIAAAYIRRRVTVPMWEAYVGDVGASLAAHVRRPEIRYTFHVIDAPAVNAFALPGGQVFLFKGLLDIITSEAELAAVLAHEIAHVDNRHAIERFQYQIRMKKIGLGELSELGTLAQTVIQAGYSQYREQEADAWGLYALMAASYHPQAAVDLFRRLLAVDRPAEVAARGIVEYLRSHPPTAERMRRLEYRIARERGKQPGRTFYRGAENFRKRVARSRQEFDGEKMRW